jgi:biopolymer transport protein ExbD
MDLRPILGLAILLLAACASPTPGAPAGTVVIRLAVDPADTCRASLGDSLFALPADEAAFTAALRARAREARNATVDANPLVPYTCFGNAVSLAQRAGFERVGFIAEPPPGPHER